jgi:hypothetical protein
MTKNRSSGIPFKADDPRYSRAWYLINKQGKTMEEALAIIRGMGEKKGSPKPRPVERVKIIVEADTTQATQAIQDLQAQVKQCTEDLARIMNVKLEGEINPLEALFYIADLQKEILAELKIISGTLHRKGP